MSRGGLLPQTCLLEVSCVNNLSLWEEYLNPVSSLFKPSPSSGLGEESQTHKETPVLPTGRLNLEYSRRDRSAGTPSVPIPLVSLTSSCAPRFPGSLPSAQSLVGKSSLSSYGREDFDFLSSSLRTELILSPHTAVTQCCPFH